MAQSTPLIVPPPHLLVIGVDEAGRGCWAGPVVAAAVAWGEPIDGLNDSKKLSAERRQGLVPLIQAGARAWAVGEASAAEIDRLNILQATHLAMTRAIDALATVLDVGGQILVDGNRLPKWARAGWQLQAVVGGDATHAPIAAASILAKEHRDGLMIELDARHPGYGFARHKSYGTAEHQEALVRLGPCAEHRQSFRPIKALLTAQK